MNSERDFYFLLVKLDLFPDVQAQLVLEYWRDLRRFDSNEVLLYREQAARGDSLSQARLGYCYEHALGGVGKDFQEAHRYYRLSSLQDCGDGHAGLGNFYLRGRYVKQDIKMGMEYIKKALKEEIPRGYGRLGWYENMNRNSSAAAFNYSLAVEGGDIESQYNLALCYAFGQGVKKDLKKAFELAQSAGEQGYLPAIHFLGRSYQKGRGTQKNRVEAFSLFQKAARKGYLFSQNALGECFENGYGIGVSLLEAKKSGTNQPLIGDTKMQKSDIT